MGAGGEQGLELLGAPGRGNSREGAILPMLSAQLPICYTSWVVELVRCWKVVNVFRRFKTRA
jgi:hypothetical protein